MDYSHISSLFAKQKNILDKHGADARAVVSVIKHHVDCDITEKDLIIKSGSVKIKASPILLGEIFLKKDKILADLKVLNITKIS